VLVALVAVLIAAGSAIVAVYSLSVARQAKSDAAAARSLTGQAPPRASAAPTTAAPTPTPSPTPVFAADLRGLKMTIPPTEGCASSFVDVDGAQVGTFSGHDFYFTSCVGPLTIRMDAVDAAAASAPNPTPEACASLLTGIPSTPEAQLPATAGLTICLITSKQAALRAGIPQRIAVITINQVAADKTVTLELSTYRVPA
jgi:hypothetical protein